MTVNGVPLTEPVIKHEALFSSEKVDIVFEMSDKVEAWGNDAEVLEALGVRAGWMPAKTSTGRGDDL